MKRDKIRKKMSRIMKGRNTPWLKAEKNPNWKGGYEGYYGPNWLKKRREAREREDHTCRLCGKNVVELSREPSIHHLVPFRNFGIEKYREANKLKNLISLCRSCHKKVEINPEEYKAILEEKMKKDTI